MKTEIFSWLHLSDIHFQPDTGSFNDDLVRESLPEFIEENQMKGQVLVISGDFRFAPKKNETNANQAIDYIRKIAVCVGVDDHHVVLVPGNHDLERSKSRDNQILGTRKDYDVNVGTIDKGVQSLLTHDFDFYNSVKEPFKNSLNLKGDNPHGIIDMGCCYLLLLNTSLLAGMDDEAHQLILGSRYVNSLLSVSAEKKPIIAVGHHGLSLLENSEQKEITRLLDSKGVRLYLCGHEHDNWVWPFSEHGKQVNVGCMKQGNDDVIVGFEYGRIYDNGDADVTTYKWDRDSKCWYKDEPNSKYWDKLYDMEPQSPAATPIPVRKVEMTPHSFMLKGYQLIGGLGCDGIKYVWEKGQNLFVESLAFNQRIRLQPTEADTKTSAYTISSSLGCMLSTMRQQCIFCQTGAQSFVPLTAEDLALQAIFMAEYDSNCPSYPEVRSNMREFAFMGQGEPGYCYDAVKRAILLTDFAMKRIGQTVSRYIISSCGIMEFLPSLIQDCKNGIYSNRVTLHFSLNAIDGDRDQIMPINQTYNYQDVIAMCHKLYQVTHEKIGVGILLLVDYKTTSGKYISLDSKKLKEILGKLDPEVFKVDLCTVNKTDLGSQRPLSNEDANKYLQLSKDMGFESKIFASFGDGEEMGCGMLRSSISNLSDPGSTTIAHFNQAIELLNEAKKNI